jgi:DNA replication and repair protein RecF
VIKAVSFVPSDLRLVDGSPQGRRDFLDRATFTLHSEYLGEVRTYRAALAQKNALLRDARASRRPPDPGLLATWQEPLIAAGARLIQRRTDFLKQFAPIFREVHEEITGAAKGHATFRYKGCIAPESLAGGFDAIAEGLRTKMQLAASVEASRGFCTVGPHRDDWELHVGDEALRRFGSQGQVRSAALALRLAQMVLAQRGSGSCPLFLLDDVSSELDASRNRHLMDLVQSLPTQVFITTTDRSNLRIDSGQSTSWRIRAGTLEFDGD